MYTKYSILYTIYPRKILYTKYIIHNGVYKILPLGAQHTIFAPSKGLKLFMLILKLFSALKKFLWVNIRSSRWEWWIGLRQDSMFIWGLGKFLGGGRKNFKVPRPIFRIPPALHAATPLLKTYPLFCPRSAYAAWNQIKFLRMRVSVRAPRWKWWIGLRGLCFLFKVCTARGL